ncbi:MAG: hemolysin activation protein [Prevotella sp.]
MKNAAKTDVAVLLLFFNRPEPFRLVFNEVKKARPSRLFLYQDGARNERDVPGIEACRKIAEDIDWDCEVHRMYLDTNQGCDPSGHRSQKWAFSIVDKCIVLEDDCVPSQSFFPFCKEMLDRYEKDERISMIAGFNTDEVTTYCPNSYFFTSAFSIWGWASWRRVFEKRQEDYAFIHDTYAMSLIEAMVKDRGLKTDMTKMMKDHAKSGKEYFESLFWAAMLLNSGLAIMPSKNQINNVGMTAESTHYSASLNTTPRRLRRIYTMKRHELDFPLRHPRHVIEDVTYLDRLYKTYAWNHPWIKISYSLEELWLNLIRGNFGVIFKSLRRRIRKWLGREKFK